ncbi:hypothetical protein ONA91_32210 [Micromonospora sp. DR5-3]|uniref:TSCPD domain-containing protein n=1 Tax=unclassified Micromonospora TaxID=2617518 RepID=UPI0011DA6B00|nr:MULTISPECIES: hypothetical protein [unclassified Micromonospora]MCW3819114.1 hypothetical protein [Micromonospora sp. DR5-3]TYC21843.1 hypothetical protein FXF52_24010 [Micromonospora sp. MP36]
MAEAAELAHRGGDRTMTDPEQRVPASQRRPGSTVEFVLDGTEGRLITAVAPDGRLTHVDLRVDKHGSTLAGLTEALSIAVTTGLRAGAPVSAFVTELWQTRYTPAGRTDDPEVPEATSLGDYLARRLHHLAVERPHDGAPRRPAVGAAADRARTGTR